MEKNPKLILASASPRRKELLSKAGVCFETQIPDVDESRLLGEAPRPYVARLARKKALAIADSAAHNAYVLAADTTVVVGDQILGKPGDEAEAFEFLSLISGRTHEVLTGVCLILAPSQTIHEGVYASQVTMKALSHSEIKAYIRTGEPMDKAGAYAAQGKGRQLIEKIEGSLNNVIGLPVEELLFHFKQVGVWP